MSSWREDPKLEGRFHQEYPDDLQVIVHEGGPRLTDKRPELIWVRIISNQGSAYVGTLLNQPDSLGTLKLGDNILFIAHETSEYPLRVTEKYLLERNRWTIEPCTKCGLSELFDAPSDLIRKLHPNPAEGESVEGFTSFCPMCGGVQIVMDKSRLNTEERKWWQFWK